MPHHFLVTDVDQSMPRPGIDHESLSNFRGSTLPLNELDLARCDPMVLMQDSRALAHFGTISLVAPFYIPLPFSLTHNSAPWRWSGLEQDNALDWQMGASPIDNHVPGHGLYGFKPMKEHEVLFRRKINATVLRVLG